MVSRSDAEQARDSAPKVGAHAGQRQTLGKYEIRKRIGSGGMGSVFLAFDPDLRRTVALKILPREKAQNEILVKRFKAEAQAAAHLRHDNIVAIYDAGEADGYLFIALEYVEGTDLQNLVSRRGPLPVKRSIEIVKQVARALQHAHERNIVHRDIKPSNMLISADGTVKLTDMGLARSIDETTETDITRAGTTVGTVDYMAPEQARNSRAADIRSDIYSLGCAWYQMLTGKPPFGEGSVTNKLQAHAVNPPPDPRDANPEVPETLVAVMHRMMAKSPDQRYQTPQELLNDLESTSLSRGTVSTAVLAALAEEDAPAAPARGTAASAEARASVSPAPPEAPTVPARTGRSRNRAAARKASVPEPSPASASRPTLPPKSPRKQQLEEGSEPRPRNLEALKYVLVVAAVVGLIALLYWIVTTFSSALDYSAPPDQRNPFQEDVRGGESPSQVLATTKKATGPEPGGPRPREEQVREKVARARDPGDSPTSPADPVRRGPAQQAISDWAGSVAPLGDDPSLAKLPTFTVGRAGDGPPAGFATLTAALAEVPESGGRVQLVGDGPFVLPATELRGRQVVLSAAEGSRPVVLLVPQNRMEHTGALLRMVEGALGMVGIHLVAVAGALPAEGDVSLVESAASDLAIRRCSVTLIGERTGTTAAIRITGAVAPDAAKRSRTLLEQTFVRGSGLTAIRADGAALDFAATQSLFVSGSAPLLSLTNTISGFVSAGAPAGPQSNGPHDESAVDRSIGFDRCTAVSGRTAFVFEPGRREPPRTEINVATSLVSAAEHADTVLLSLGNWPSATEVDGSRVRNLQWAVDGSVFFGWKQLVVSESAVGANAGDAATWNGLWATAADELQFQPRAWENPEISDPSGARPEAFAARMLELPTFLTGRSPVGCDVGLLSTPAGGRIDRAAAIADRRLNVPVSMLAKHSSQEIRIDLSKQDLGRILSEGDWPSGARFVVSGSGTYKCRPIRVKGRSFRLEFEESEGPPLVVEPRSIDYRRGGEAFISVADAEVEILNGRFRLMGTTRRDIPEALLHVENGGFSLEHCYVIGPMTESPGFETLVRWSGASEGADSAIANSFFATDGAVVELNGPGSLVVRNSVLASIGSLLVCRAGGASVDLRQCTLSATSAFFDVHAAVAGADAPLAIFADATVFAPPLEGGATPVLLADRGEAHKRGRIEWWENGNGYAEEVQPLKLNDRDWDAVWGLENRLRPLLAPDGARLQENYPQRTKITPQSFAVRGTSRAATWSSTGGPIGADVDALPEIERPERPREPERPPPRRRPSTPGPDF